MTAPASTVPVRPTSPPDLAPERPVAWPKRHIRTLGNGMRVLVMTAQAAELETRIACLEAGADDCMMKPFAMRELKARCRARRRTATVSPQCPL